MTHSATELVRNAHGFRERGAQVTRLEAFVDAAFAFAVTLLVISFDGLPKNVPELLAAYKGIPAFAASFALLAMFWRAHERWSRWYGLDDNISTTLSLILVLLVLVYVYPLRTLFASFFAFVSDKALPAAFEIKTATDLRWMFGSYAVASASLSSVVLLLFAYAWRQRQALGLDAEERVQTRITMLRWIISIGVSMVSFGLTFLIGPVFTHGWMLAIPGMIYFLMILNYPLIRWGNRRWRAQEGLPPA